MNNSALRLFLFLFLQAAFLGNQAFSQEVPKPDSGNTEKTSPEIVEAIKFKGLQSLDESEIVKMFRDEGLFIAKGTAFQPDKVTGGVKLIEKALFSVGYQDAEVSVLVEKAKNNSRIITFKIVEGIKTPIIGIQFTGNNNFSNNELAEPLKTCLGEAWQFFQSRYYDYCLNKNALSIVRSKGFLRAKFGAPEIHRAGDGAVVWISLEEGLRFRLGEVRISGVNVFSRQEILDLLELKKGEPVDGKKLREGLFEKLKKNYENRGYIQFDAELEPEFLTPEKGAQDAVINLSIQIYEGKSFKLAEIEFTGVDETTAKVLRQMINIRNGQTFNQEEFEKGIEKINELEKFEYLDGLRDSDFVTDEENGSLYLKIKVREIKK